MYTGMSRIRRIVKLLGMFIDRTYNRGLRRTRGSILVRGWYLVNAVAVVAGWPYNSRGLDILPIGRLNEHVTADV